MILMSTKKTRKPRPIQFHDEYHKRLRENVRKSRARKKIEEKQENNI